MDSAPQTDCLLAAARGGDTLLRVVGRGSVKLGGRLDDFGTALVESGEGDLVVDLARARALDSTFMGILARIASDLRKAGRRMVLVHMADPVEATLRGIGIHYLSELRTDPASAIEFDDLLAEAGSEVTTNIRTWEDQKRLVGRAHEILAGISEENRKRFQPVVDQCRKASAGNRRRTWGKDGASRDDGE